MNQPKPEITPEIQDELLVKRLKDYDTELEEMRKKEEKAKKEAKANKPMINKTNKMILCAVIFGLLVIACMAIPAGPGLAAVAIATAGVGAYGLATAVKGGMKSFKSDPIKEAKEAVRDERINKIREGLDKDNEGDEAEQNNPVSKNNTHQDLKGIVDVLVNKRELEKIQEKILKNAKEVLGEDFEIENSSKNKIKLFDGDNFEKFIENLSAGLEGDSRNISQSISNADKGQGELFKEFVQATLGEDKFSEKKLRLNGLKDIFKDWNTPDSDALGVNKKDAAKNMLNGSCTEGNGNNAILKPAINKAEEKVKDAPKAKTATATRSTPQPGGSRV